MEEWKECKLGDLCIDNKGSYGIAASAVPYSENLYTYLRITDINDDGTLNKSDLKSVADENAEQYILQPNDIVFARTGGSTGRNYFYDGSDGVFVYAGFLIKFSIDPSKVNPKYIKYFCLSQEYKNWVYSFNTGSTRGNINAQTYANMPVILPPRSQQDLLVKTLSFLDDKIELNNKINTNLEQQAQALFKNWFVDFEPFGGKMPEGWKEKPLYDYADYINGTSFKEDEYDTKGVPIIKIAELKNGITDATQYFNGEKDPKYDVKNGDILFSWSGNPETSIDIFIWSLGDGILNQHTFNVKSNTDRKWFTYCLLKYFKPEFCHRASCKQTTGLGHVTANDLKQITFSSGEKAESDFENLIAPIMKQIFNNKLENQKLVNIRDTLLPKLMNGEFVI